MGWKGNKLKGKKTKKKKMGSEERGRLEELKKQNKTKTEILRDFAKHSS